MKILVTGAAGFIGMHTSRALLEAGHEVIGIDNLNDYYDPGLKIDRLAELEKFENFLFLKIDISDREAMNSTLNSMEFSLVIHLAAQAGVRYSIENPHTYIDSNISGFLNVLEACRKKCISKLIYASSSSVYGGNQKIPFSESDPVEKPISLYAATKRSNELMAYTYSNLYGFPSIGLRFFTVYGPWGRPDMAIHIFTKNILSGRPIEIFNNGNLMRDFTYIDDVVFGILSVALGDCKLPKKKHPKKSYVLNIGNGSPISIIDVVDEIEKNTGIRAVKIFKGMQPGDMERTYSDIRKIRDGFGFSPKVCMSAGIYRFVSWFKSYYQEKHGGGKTECNT